MPKAQTKATAPTPAPDTPLPVEYAVRIYPVKDSKYTLANANVDINGVFAIRGMKVIRGEQGPFVAMPVQGQPRRLPRHLLPLHEGGSPAVQRCGAGCL